MLAVAGAAAGGAAGGAGASYMQEGWSAAGQPEPRRGSWGGGGGSLRGSSKGAGEWLEVRDSLPGGRYVGVGSGEWAHHMSSTTLAAQPYPTASGGGRGAGAAGVGWEREEAHRAEVRGLRAEMDEAKEKAIKLEAKNSQLQGEVLSATSEIHELKLSLQAAERKARDLDSALSALRVETQGRVREGDLQAQERERQLQTVTQQATESR